MNVFIHAYSKLWSCTLVITFLSSDLPLLFPPPSLSSEDKMCHHSPSTKDCYNTIDCNSPLLKPCRTQAVISLAWHRFLCQRNSYLTQRYREKGQRERQCHSPVLSSWFVVQKQSWVLFKFDCFLIQAVREEAKMFWPKNNYSTDLAP